MTECEKLTYIVRTLDLHVQLEINPTLIILS